MKSHGSLDGIGARVGLLRTAPITMDTWMSAQERNTLYMAKTRSSRKLDADKIYYIERRRNQNHRGHRGHRGYRTRNRIRLHVSKE
jgi:hypothetical protein